jgi:(p)ppGpp synthase/HD superfamily hydrolase
MTLVEKAREFAIRAHGDQKYGDKPYVYHLDAVANLVTEFGPVYQAAAYLHDILEDTKVTSDEIRKEFGDDITEAVILLTDEPGRNRKERKAKTNQKLAATDNKVALVVKAADRLANMEESAKDPSSGKLDMYIKEYNDFAKAVYRLDFCDNFNYKLLWYRMTAYFSII